MNENHRKPLLGTNLDYFDARAAVEAITPDAYAQLPYTSRVLAEQLVRRCDPADLTEALKQLIDRKRDRDFPQYPARVVRHDILGQTTLARRRMAPSTIGAISIPTILPSSTGRGAISSVFDHGSVQSG